MRSFRVRFSHPWRSKNAALQVATVTKLAMYQERLSKLTSNFTNQPTVHSKSTQILGRDGINRVVVGFENDGSGDVQLCSNSNGGDCRSGLIFFSFTPLFNQRSVHFQVLVGNILTRKAFSKLSVVSAHRDLHF